MQNVYSNMSDSYNASCIVYGCIACREAKDVVMIVPTSSDSDSDSDDVVILVAWQQVQQLYHNQSNYYLRVKQLDYRRYLSAMMIIVVVGS